jgi:selenocysteine lyase/cysteine desulfurase
MGGIDQATLTELRTREFPITAEYTYLNTATQSPLPNCTRHAIEQATINAQFPDTGRPWVPIAEQVRGQLATLLRAKPDDIALTASTTHGLNICAQGIDWRPGDNVVLPAREFPSVLTTWLHLRTRGVEVRLVPWQGAGPSVDELMAAVDRHTRVVSCSAVAWDTGYRMDLETLGQRCAAAGCLLIVDGIQAVGALDLDLPALGVSALSFHGYKWLMGGFGVGAMYVAPNAIEQIQPTFVGEQAIMIAGYEPETPFEWQPGARRYAAGGYNLLGMHALSASLRLIEQIGLGAIAAHHRHLTDQLVAGLGQAAPAAQMISPANSAQRAGIVTFTLGDPTQDEDLVQELGKQGIIVVLRRRGIRVSPHLFNTEAEIERLLLALAEIVQRSTRA